MPAEVSGQRYARRRWAYAGIQRCGGSKDLTTEESCFRLRSPWKLGTTARHECTAAQTRTIAPCASTRPRRAA